MPLYSDSNYYYSGGSSQLYSPYYPQSTYSSPQSPSYSSSYNRSFGGSYSLPLTPPRTPTYATTHGLGSRYQPKLTTITESSPLLSSRHGTLLPLTRINSPKYTTYSSPGTSTHTGRYIPPRPILINTADIDVSSSRYGKKHEPQRQTDTKSPGSSIKRTGSVEKKTEKSEEPVKNEKNEQGKAARTTIKRNRPVVRLSTIRSRSKERKTEITAVVPERTPEPIDNKVKAGETEITEHLPWREKLAADLELLNTKTHMKSPGEILRERYLIQHEDDYKPTKRSREETLPELVVELDPIDNTIRRLSIPQCPTFHDICEDISSDKIDDDLNAGVLRRRASLIQEQEQELLNTLQKSASGSFQLIHLERRCSQDSLPDETLPRQSQRKSKKSKKVRHKITATVDVDNSPLMPVLVEREEDSGMQKHMDNMPKPKFSFNVEAVEEHHEIHKVFKLPKKKSIKKAMKPKKEHVLPEGFMYATPKIMTPPKLKKGEIKTYVSTAEIFTFDPNSAVDNKQTETKQNKQVNTETTSKSTDEAALESILESIRPNTNTTTDSVLKTSASLDSAEAYASKKSEPKLKKTQSLQAEELKISHTPKTITPTYTTTTSLELAKPKTAEISTTSDVVVTSTESEQKVATPKPIRKVMPINKSDSGDDFWSQMGTRETLYMTNRKKTSLETQWQKCEDLLEAQTTEEIKNLEDIKNVISAQKEQALNKAEEACKADEKSALERSHSNESKQSTILTKTPSTTLNATEAKADTEPPTASKSPKKKSAEKTPDKTTKKVSPVKKLKSPIKKKTTEDNASSIKTGKQFDNEKAKIAEKITDDILQKERTQQTKIDSKMLIDDAKTINNLNKEDAEKLQKAKPKLTQATTTTTTTTTEAKAFVEQSITNATAKIAATTMPPKINTVGQQAKSPEQQQKQLKYPKQQTLVEVELLKSPTTNSSNAKQQNETNAVNEKLINNTPDANKAAAKLPINALQITQLTQKSTTATTSRLTNAPITIAATTKQNETEEKCTKMTETNKNAAALAVHEKVAVAAAIATTIAGKTEKGSPKAATTNTTTISATPSVASINADQFLTAAPAKSTTSPTKSKTKTQTSPGTKPKTTVAAKTKAAATAATTTVTAATTTQVATKTQANLSTMKQAETLATKTAVALKSTTTTPAPPPPPSSSSSLASPTTTTTKTTPTKKTTQPLSPLSPTLENTNNLAKSPPRVQLNNNLSKFATVSNLAQCLQDVDADLADYIPSSAENSSDDNYSDIDTDSSFDYSSAYGCVNPTESMKKKLKQRRKKEKKAEKARFDPQKKIKIDTTTKCYVKDEPPRYPLVATPRPLWKRENIEYSDEDTEDSDSDEGSGSTEDTTDDSEECSSEEYDDDLRSRGGSDAGATNTSANTAATATPKEKSSIIRMSTCSNDSGFEGGTAPSSPKKMLECDVNCHKKCERLTANLCGVNQKLIVEALAHVKRGARENRDSPSTPPSSNPAYKIEAADEQDETSYTYSQFQKSGRFTPPATVIPRFKNYNVDDFHFLAVLGKGSFGKVLLAELRDTTYYYAVKCLKKDVVLEDDDVDSTLIERKVLALGTKHPYLCHLFCTFQTESHLFFVMEYLNGGDLMFHIQESGRFSEERARFYGAEIISGLKFLHKKGIIYRDLKLDNVLLDYEGHVRIADFGMCKLQIYLDKTADSFCGTPDYMAPEIIKGEKYNQNVDWWSFGVLLYEMLIGQSPFSGCDEDELFWSICNEIPWFPVYISAEATSILKGLLEKDYTKRIGSQYSLAGDIADHIFFRPIEWNLLEKRQIEPPYKPQVKHPLDTQYFDRVFTRERVRLTPIDKEILQSMDQKQFLGFTYTNPHITLD